MPSASLKASTGIYSQVESNKTKTILIMAFFSLFIATVAFILGKAIGDAVTYAGVALAVSAVMSLGSYYYGDRMVLAMSGAKEAERERDFDLYTVTENLAIAAGIPKPKVYIIEDPAPNAFATGRDPRHAVVCATRGLLQKMNRRELEGVIAHEMSHVRNFDIRLMAVVTVLVGTAAFLSDWFMRMLWWGGGRRNSDDRNGSSAVFFIFGVVLALLSPVIATLIQLSISRRREFLADASGALLTRYPEGLASALEKIAADKSVLKTASNATAHLYIVNPFKGKNFLTWFSSLFDTHPPIEERIKILRSM